MNLDEHDDGAPYDDVNVTPMVDLTLVLLIIFIIMTTTAAQGIEVDLPQASAKPPMTDPGTRAVSIAASGQLYLDTFPVSLPELEQRLAQDASRPVAIKGDASVDYQHVIEVLDLCGRLGITQVGLVTRKFVL